MTGRHFSKLKEKQRRVRDTFPEEFGLKVHRALSWLERAEQEVIREDFDAGFIFHWISFNAAYAGDLSGGDAPSERKAFREYFKLLMLADRRREIHGAIWEKFSGPIRVLLKNPYVFSAFWAAQANGSPDTVWRLEFDKSWNSVNNALVKQDTQKILEVVFDRLYVLRNQLVHGGATWKSSINREQVRDGGRIVGFLVPVFIDLMMDNPHAAWGRPQYPVVKDV